MFANKKLFLFQVLLLLCLCPQQFAYTQCISTFPYNEDFETTNGNWIPGGVSSDWVWGIPSKPVILSAGGGIKCWTTGGLTGSAYNGAESSWLQSPCFDFNSLITPQISFKVFWETEQQYDGANFQYSTNGGSTWNILGSQNSNANCVGINWFNYSPINFLSGAPGWSGNIQPTFGQCLGGGGSGKWLLAKHDLSAVAGLSNVIFRFAFGSGNICNNYDGFAIDDILIGEGKIDTADFDYLCNGNKTVQFLNIPSPCETSLSWNFGDATSGINNTSVLDSPNHVFSAAGTYTVSLTATFASGTTSTTTKNVTVLTVIPITTNLIQCGGDSTGAVTAMVTGGNGMYNYFWNTNPPQTTQSVSGLPAATYTVTVTSATACGASASVTIQEPIPVTVNPIVTDATCGMNNGSVATAVTGGSSPYLYSWSTGSTTSSINNLAPGTYSVTVIDANGCTKDSNNILVVNVNTLAISTAVTPASCGISNGSVSATIMGGSAPYKYSWSTGDTTSSINNIPAGNYSLLVTDANGCTAAVNNIQVPNAMSTLAVITTTISASCGINDGSVAASVSGGAAPYKYAWSTGDTTSSINNIAAGTYSLLVTDAIECTVAANNILVTIVNRVAITTVISPASCGLNNGSIAASVAGGTSPYQYTWSTGQTTSTINNLSPGNYSLITTDAKGCADTASNIVVLSISPTKPNLGNDTTICPGQNLVLNPGVYVTYQWQDSTTSSTYAVTQTGTYFVMVTDASGCTASDTILVTVSCTDIYFPSAFTPNGDGRNDYFGPLGGLGGMKNYSLIVYTRWGQVVFSSTDPFKKWDGMFKGRNADATTYVWASQYVFDGKKRFKKGTVTIIY